MVLFYAFLGMVCWGLAPLFGKLGLNGVNPTAALSLRTLIAATFVTSWVIGTRGYSEVWNIPLLLWVFIAIEAILATLLGDLAYFFALKYGNVNVVTLIMACAPLVTMLANYLFLGDVATWRQLFGALMITFGLLLVCLE
ncbi:MAG: EamA family transporter [Negativicutes bacterium]|nr:EamA family transporter [Negativicutes bacterium]